MRGHTWVVLVLVAVVTAGWAAVEQELKPYVMASVPTGTIAEHSDIVRQAVAAQGFAVVGSYKPYDGAEILVVTSDDLKQTAAQSPFGGYGATLRVSLTQVGDHVQIAYTSPAYIANVYRLQGNHEVAAGKLRAALGWQKEFGSKAGIKAEKLRNYHYTIMMPYFDDQEELAQHASFAQAAAAVEAGLAANVAGTEKIYRVDVGAQSALFGVALRQGNGADVKVMENCDQQDLKHTAYMPYEILVSGGRAYALPGKFRIAISFPDLSMPTFMKISRAPGAIKNALQDVAETEIP